MLSMQKILMKRIIENGVAADLRRTEATQADHT